MSNIPNGFLREDPWRIFRIMAEFVDSFETMSHVGPSVTVFGSARTKPTDRFYKVTVVLSDALAREGLAVITGGGPGIMEAANRGAKGVGGASIGCNIQLPEEQRPNPYLDRWITFEHFFVRRVMLVKYSYAFIAMPGGYGTLDEVFETATQIQTGKIQQFPLVLMGRDYWEPLLAFMRERLVAERTVEPEDVDRFIVTDSPEEAVELITQTALARFGLTYGATPRRSWLLGE